MTNNLPIRLAAGSGPTFGVDDLACATASHLGCWEEEGLDVTWTPVHGGVAAMQSVLNGETDASYGGLGPVLKFRAEGQPVRIIVSMARALAQNLIVQPDITSPEELRGKSWAIDGFGALSHHMSRLVVRALNIGEDEIDWQAVGPPPERIARLLEASIDVSLIRVEEATSLDSDTNNKLHTLLGFAELKDLVPIQPHGVLATTEAYEQAHPEQMLRLTKGMIRASRALNDDFENFRKVYDHHVTVKVDDEKVHDIWQKERDSGGFAVNGELTNGHWKSQMELFYELHSELPEISRGDLIAENFVAQALEDLGVQPGQDVA